MIWERLLFGVFGMNEGVYLALDAAFIALAVFGLVFSAFLFMKAKPWWNVISASGGKLAVICDEGARQVFFYPIKKIGNLNSIIGRGLRVWSKDGTYIAPDQNCSVGIFSSRVAVNLPLQYSDFFSEATKSEASGERGESPVVKVVEGVFKGEGGELKPIVKQVTFGDFEKWLMHISSPYVLQEELESKARKLARLDDLDREAGAAFDLKKILMIAVVVGIIAFAALMFLR